MNIKFFFGLVPIFSMLAIFFLNPSSAFSQVNAFRPVKTLCGAIDSEGKTFVVIDFETRLPKEVGSLTDKWASAYVESTYPVQQYRLISVSGRRFRIGTQVTEQAYAPGQFMTFLSIYEEVSDKLVQRSFITVPIDSIGTSYRFGYEVPNSETRISCHLSLLNQVSQLRVKDTMRKPAKVNDKKIKSDTILKK